MPSQRLDVYVNNVPAGIIVLWSGPISDNFDSTGMGVNQMAGWALCNGQNATPNLIDKFVMGTDATPRATGGAAQVGLTADNIPLLTASIAHGHPTKVTDNGHTHEYCLTSTLRSDDKDEQYEVT